MQGVTIESRLDHMVDLLGNLTINASLQSSAIQELTSPSRSPHPPQNPTSLPALQVPPEVPFEQLSLRHEQAHDVETLQAEVRKLREEISGLRAANVMVEATATERLAITAAAELRTEGLATAIRD